LKDILKKLAFRKINIDLDDVRKFINEAIVFLKIPLILTGFESYDDYIMFDRWNEGVKTFFGIDSIDDISRDMIDDFSQYLYELITTVTSLEKSVKNMTCLFVPSITRNGEYNFLENSEEQENTVLQLVEFFRDISSEKGRRNGTYFRFMSYCKILFPDLERIDIGYPEGSVLPEDLFLTWRQNGKEKYQPLSRSGGGVYNALFLLAKLLNNYNDLNIVFIDEPEMGLHPMLQQRFIKLLRKISREFAVKWVLATHSPFILQNLKNGEKLYLIEHNGIQTYSTEIDVDNKEEVFLALGAYLPLTFSAKGVIFVEGQTEVKVLTILLNKVGFDLDKERLLIIPLGGENIFKIEPKDIKKLHEKSMVIIDSDLTKPEEQGGNIKKIKIEYGNICKENKVEFIMLKEYRTLENMYPKDVLAKVLNQEETKLTYGKFDEIPGIDERNKVKIGESVANEISVEQAKEFPLVKEILRWWKEE
jgi:hypothetical protein